MFRFRNLRVFTFSGVPVELHFTFLLFLAYCGWMGWQDGLERIQSFSPAGQIWPSDSIVPHLILKGPPETWAAKAKLWLPWIGLGWQLMFVLLAFGCVVLHEFGHIFAGRFFGIPTYGVTLLPIGGIARMAAIPREPLREFVVAIAGPLVNVAIVAVLWPFFGFDLHTLYTQSQFSLSEFGRILVIFNAIMAVFNLLPIFPMDGGRVARAFLASFLAPITATRIVVWLAPFVATGLIWFLVHQLGLKPWLTVVLLAFVMTGGYLELSQLRRAVATRNRTLGAFLTHDYLVLPVTLTVREALQACRRTGHEVFIIPFRGQFRSGRASGLAALVRKGRSNTFLDKVEFGASTPRDVTASASDLLETHPRMLPALIPVFEHGQWVGVVNPTRFDDSL